MNGNLEKTEINIPNNWLSSGYFVYVAHINYGDKNFKYIGQTGDNKHQTARGPLYRIGGHLSKLKSSKQNQIIKGIRNNILKGNDSHEKLEQVLSKINLKYTFWKIADFDYNDTKEEHSLKRKKTQFIEHYLIYHLHKKIDLFNQKAKTDITKNSKLFFKDKCVGLTKDANEILKELGYYSLED